MIRVWGKRRIPRSAQRVDGELKGLVEALVGDFLIVFDILGDDAHDQLVQRVFDAFAVEGGHDDALFSFALSRVWTFVGGVWSAPSVPNTDRRSAPTPSLPHFIRRIPTPLLQDIDPVRLMEIKHDTQSSIRRVCTLQDQRSPVLPPAGKPRLPSSFACFERN
jgi:hypothetical protein